MSKKLFGRACAIVVLSMIPLQAFAQNAAMDAYKHAMEKMNVEMQKGMDPDPTKAWVKMMIAHHQGAVEMNKVVLKETKDPQIRTMAEKTTGEQEAEIKKLQKWLSKHGS